MPFYNHFNMVLQTQSLLYDNITKPPFYFTVDELVKSMRFERIERNLTGGSTPSREAIWGNSLKILWFENQSIWYNKFTKVDTHSKLLVRTTISERSLMVERHSNMETLVRVQSLIVSSPFVKILLKMHTAN